jgi:hypothetical protein
VQTRSRIITQKKRRRRRRRRRKERRKEKQANTKVHVHGKPAWA